MPIYTYECPECKVLEDKIFKAEERPDFLKEKCCICGEDGVDFKRVLTAPSGFRLQGKGVYKETSTFD